MTSSKKINSLGFLGTSIPTVVLPFKGWTIRIGAPESASDKSSAVEVSLASFSQHLTPIQMYQPLAPLRHQ